MSAPEQALPARTAPWALVAWPAFLAACLLEVLVFSMVDPSDVRGFGPELLAGQKAAYTLAFFCFWLICAACSALVLWLAQPAGNVNGTGGED